MQLTGKWIYHEDFGFGKSDGEVTLEQYEDCVVGVFTFTEMVDGEYEIQVEEHVEGVITDDKLLLESSKVVAFQNNEPIDYYSNHYDVYLNSESKLVGSTFDSEGVCGVFTLERKL